MAITNEQLKSGLFSCLRTAFGASQLKLLNWFYSPPNMNLDSPVRPQWRAINPNPTISTKRIKDWVGYEHEACPAITINATETNTTSHTVQVQVTHDPSAYKDTNKYNYFYKPASSGTWIAFGLTDGHHLNATTGSLSAGTAYNFKVTSNNGFGVSETTVNLTTSAPITPITVSVSPTSYVITLAQGESTTSTVNTRQFSATVTGGASQSVIWSIIQSGTYITISSAGLLTVPVGTPACTAKIRATYVNDSTIYGEATFAVSVPVVNNTVSLYEYITDILPRTLKENNLRWIVNISYRTTSGGVDNQYTIRGTTETDVIPSEKFLYDLNPVAQIRLNSMGFEGTGTYTPGWRIKIAIDGIISNYHEFNGTVDHNATYNFSDVWLNVDANKKITIQAYLTM
jgi:hypothetical protein